ncbi:MAG TPA: 2-oxo-4-hydroxy-4-carboxy-5-ureidoimidazoline decarboxylase [Candidatus Obscuribacterales bacterium]
MSKINSLSPDEAREQLGRCCGAARWVEAMVKRRPFRSADELFEAADQIWYNLSPEDWREAFSHHPKIGDLESLKRKFASTRQWSAGEQSGVDGAPEEVLGALAAGNEEYERKFGYIFIVCATGKTATEMLSLLQQRLVNDPESEIQVAMREQSKITRIRLEKLLS